MNNFCKNCGKKLDGMDCDCNKVNENNSAKLYIKRIRRFIRTIINLPYEYPIYTRSDGFYKRLEHERIDYTGKFSPSLKYCIKRFCKEHEDCAVYLYDYEKLYFQVNID